MATAELTEFTTAEIEKMHKELEKRGELKPVTNRYILQLAYNIKLIVSAKEAALMTQILENAECLYTEEDYQDTRIAPFVEADIHIKPISSAEYERMKMAHILDVPYSKLKPKQRS